VRNLGRIGFCCVCSEQHETRLREGIEPNAEELGGRSNGSGDGAQRGGARWPEQRFRGRGPAWRRSAAARYFSMAGARVPVTGRRRSTGAGRGQGRGGRGRGPGTGRRTGAGVGARRSSIGGGDGGGGVRFWQPFGVKTELRERLRMLRVGTAYIGCD